MPQSPKSLLKAASVVVSPGYFASSAASDSLAAAPAVARADVDEEALPEFGAGKAVPLAVLGGRAPGPRRPARVFARIEDTSSVLDEGTARAQGCSRHKPTLPAARSTASAAVPAHGSHGGVNRLPKTSEAALRTRGPVMRWRSVE